MDDKIRELRERVCGIVNCVGIKCINCKWHKKISHIFRELLPAREPVMPGEPSPRNDVIDEIEKRLKEFEEGK